ncbi:AAA family ATPase [Acinetobacter sp. ANC 5414]|uniref:AAA family ATPase n=1 Tax=Acinetobacter sp. ANC 5414 TaxID=2731251 RepID=UPI0014905CBE|nr:AAA family ATPase [Acinetobacter sp. ANC 5414]NNH01494.1 AAA domain-containing protein [Acinetobacter sp. ANC 5414]
MSNFILEDLNQLTTDCRETYKNLPNKTDIFLSQDLINKLKPLLDQELKADTKISDYSVEYTNKQDQFAIFPSKWLWVALAFYPLAEAFNAYSEVLAELKKIPEFKDSEFLKQYPMKSEPTVKSPEQTKFETEALTILQVKNPTNANSNFLNFKQFIYDRAWWNLGNVSTKLDKASGKTFERGNTDLFKSTLLTATQFIVSTSDKLSEVIYAVTLDKSLIADLNAIKSSINMGAGSSSSVSSTLKVLSESGTAHTTPGENIIFFGAPGTGKSNEINNLVDEKNSIRTVFHAETYFSDFVGCLKPTMGLTGVEYKFQIGPFTEILIKALNDPAHHYYLVIEEINRAKSAAVFGEIFQLLDRKNGVSKYSIKINDQDLIKILTENLTNPLIDNQIRIPSNLSIYATMNTSDQAVEPMDSAFKRRWKYIYKPIDFESFDEDGNPSHAQGSFELQRATDAICIAWKDFALKVNNILSNLDIPEDRHLGPWFVSTEEIDTIPKANETLKNKILMYLWDDVLRHHEKTDFFIEEIKTFGQLNYKVANDKVVFNDEFLKSCGK